MTKRLGALLFYDKDGIIDDYLTFLLEKMSEHVSKVVLICNGKITDDSKSKIERYVDSIFVRPNEGYDATGWKELFTKFLSKEELSEYDELVMFNDSFYGPVFPLSEMFDEMDSRSSLDFWGITAHTEMYRNKKNYVPEHIQSWFFCIRKRMFIDSSFDEFWKGLPKINDKKAAIKFFELEFTRFFEERGFCWETYIDTSEYEIENANGFNMCFYKADRIMSEKRCPFVKRDTLYNAKNTALVRNDCSIPNNCIDFIKNNTKYPIRLIFKHLIRIRNIREIYEAFNLDYILSDFSTTEEENNNRVALVIHLYYPELFKYCRDYVMSMPDNADIYITTSRMDYLEDIKELFSQVKCNKLEIIEADNRGRDLGGLLVAARKQIRDYDYICFIHDKKSLHSMKPREIEHFRDVLFECMLKSKDYVSNVIATFENDDNLGLLVPPIPYGGNLFKAFCDSWMNENNFTLALELKKKLNLNCNITPDMAPLTIGSVFWCKSKALKKILEYDWTYEDFPEILGKDGGMPHAIERIFGYVAQDAGYYTGVVFPISMAEKYISNISYMLRETVIETGVLERKGGVTFNYFIGRLNKKNKLEKKQKKELQKDRKKLNSRKYLIKRAVLLTAKPEKRK